MWPFHTHYEQHNTHNNVWCENCVISLLPFSHSEPHEIVFGHQSTSCIKIVKTPLVPARSTSWLAQTTLVHLLKSGTHHLAELVTHFLAPVHINMLKAQYVMSGNFPNTLYGTWWEPNLPTYKITASIWAEHNPNSTNPWCSSHTHPFLTNSVLHLSCKNSQENMSASPCSSNVMFFHLLMLLCACTNLNVMIEIFLKTLSFSEHLEHTALVWPPSNHGPPRREMV